MARPGRSRRLPPEQALPLSQRRPAPAPADPRHGAARRPRAGRHDGAGIFTLAGQQAALDAGPAVVISFCAAALVCCSAGTRYASCLDPPGRRQCLHLHLRGLRRALGLAGRLGADPRARPRRGRCRSRVVRVPRGHLRRVRRGAARAPGRRVAVRPGAEPGRAGAVAADRPAGLPGPALGPGARRGGRGQGRRILLVSPPGSAPRHGHYTRWSRPRGRPPDDPRRCWRTPGRAGDVGIAGVFAPPR